MSVCRSDLGSTPGDARGIDRLKMRVPSHAVMNPVAISPLLGNCLNKRSHAVIKFRTSADIIVDPERPGDLIGEILAESFARNTLDDSVDKMALRNAMVSAGRSGLPPWRLFRQ